MVSVLESRSRSQIQRLIKDGQVHVAGREAKANQPVKVGRDDDTQVSFRDELGDWRLTVHCVLGARVNAPWALAIARRLTERYGVEGHVMPSDDGIVVRLPDVADGWSPHGQAAPVGADHTNQAGWTSTDAPVGADLVAFDPDEIAAIVEETVGTSAMFAARFRECAARALLLPPASAVMKISRAPGYRFAPTCFRRTRNSSAARCGSSASARPNCSKWLGSTRTFRSRSRPLGNAYRTCSTCPAWSA